MIETLASGVLSRGGFDMLATPADKRSSWSTLASPGGTVFQPGALPVRTYTGKAVSPNTAMAYTAVWACVKIIAEAVGGLPLLTYRNVSPDGLVRNLATDDYRYRMLREQPNPEQSSMQWREFGQASLSLWGNWFNWIDWDSRGRVRAIWPMRPDWVMVLRNPRTMELEYRYQPLSYFSSPIPAGVYHPFQILHVAGLGWDGVVGYSPIAMCRNAVALGQSYEEQGGRFVAGGGSQKVALVSPSGTTLKDPDKIRQEWMKHNAGLENYGDVAILHGGLDVKTFGIPPRDAQFLEGRSFQLAEIARIFNVPLGMLNDVLSKPETYASAEQADIRFAKHVIRPWCTRIEQKINLSVLGSQDELTCSHDLTDLYRGDLLSQMTAYSTGANSGLIARNEGRVRMGFPPKTDDPEADKLTVQAQMIPLTTIGGAK